MPLSDDCEVTIEMDPGTFDREKIRAYKDLGITRMSMGVQTFNEDEFKTLGRGHSFTQIMDSIEELQASGFDLKQVSIDLMMGIPNQTIDSYKSNLMKSV
jgi:oxygen-independent coproporphyrinogen-3 oxidase